MNLYELLNLNKTLIDNILSTLIYTTLIYFALRSGLSGWSFLIIYVIISGILELLNISSYFNIITLIDLFIKMLLPNSTQMLFNLSYYLQI